MGSGFTRMRFVNALQVHGYLKIGVNLKKRFIPHPPQNELCADAFYASWFSSLKLHAKRHVRGLFAINFILPEVIISPISTFASLPGPVGDLIAQSKARSQGTVRCVTDDEHPVL